MADTSNGERPKGELKFIPLKNIRENPVALRPVDKESEKVKELTDSIRRVGILNPIGVREIKNPEPNGEQLYSVTDGLHRFTCAGDAGLTEIPAYVQTMSDAEVEEAQMIANMHKIETRPAQYSQQLNRMVLRNPELTMDEISKRLSRSTAWLSERLQIVKLKEELQKHVDEGRIKVSNAVALAKLPPELQDDFVQRAMTQSPGEFIPAVNTAVKAHRDAIRAGKDPNAAPTFTPYQSLQKLSEIKEVLQNPKPLADELIALAQPKTMQDCFALGVSWCLKADPKSIEIQRKKWQADLDEKARKKKEAEAERQRKKDEAAKAALAAAPAPVPA